MRTPLLFVIDISKRAFLGTAATRPPLHAAILQVGSVKFTGSPACSVTKSTLYPAVAPAFVAPLCQLGSSMSQRTPPGPSAFPDGRARMIALNLPSHLFLVLKRTPLDPQKSADRQCGAEGSGVWPNSLESTRAMHRRRWTCDGEV